MRKVTTILIAAGGVAGLSGLVDAAPPDRVLSHPGYLRRLPPPNNPADTFPISENFDSYPAGSWPCATPAPACTGPNGWGLWGAAETSTASVPGPNNGTLVTGNTHSGANALRFAPAVDIVQTGNLTTGTHEIKVWTFVPGGITSPASAQAYIIVMNTYAPPTFAGNNWSIQFKLDPISNQIIDSNNNTPHGALILNQWVEVKLVIDLGADTYSAYYNGTLAWGPINYSGAFAPGGAVRIACLDLFSDDATGVLYDDVSVQPAGVACYPDCNQDHALNVNDFICFQGAFAANNIPLADCNHDTVLNVNDFICFQSAFAAGCSQL